MLIRSLSDILRQVWGQSLRHRRRQTRDEIPLHAPKHPRN